MTWMQFVSSLVASLAWPTAVVLAAIMFRGELKALLHRLRSGKVFGTEWDFGEAIQKVEAERADLEFRTASPGLEDEGGQRTQRVYEDDRMARLAQDASSNPSYAILTAWEMVRGAALDLLGTIQKYESASATSTRSDQSRRLRDAEMRAVIAPGLARLYEELKDLRNRVAHGSANPTPGAAVAYVESADSLAKLLTDEIDSVTDRRS